MKVLAISHLPHKKFSARLHLGFLQMLQEYCEYRFISGQEVLDDPSKFAQTCRREKPDIIILYDSHAPRGRETLFPHNFFTNIPCKKVMIEVDFWKKSGAKGHPQKPKWGGLSWYSSNKFDLIIRRGCFNGASSVLGIPSVWLPFAASDEFYPSARRKIQKVGFAGAYKYRKNMTSEIVAYAQRRKAIKQLSDVGLLDRCKKCRTLEGSRNIYPRFLRNHVLGLTSAEVRSIHAKAFEIMASGAVLLTPPFKYSQTLFGSKQCYVEYQPDCSNIVERTFDILGNLQKQKQIAENAVNIINERHRSHHRIAELYNHLERLMCGQEIINVWEKP